MREWMPVFGMVLLAAGSGAWAQAGPDLPAGPVPPALERDACARHNIERPGNTRETEGRAPGAAMLGEKLAQSGGVICPPEGIDPAIRAPAPGGGETPVIPPPAPGTAPDSKPE